MSNLKDAQLVTASLQGDPTPFGALVERYQSMACAVAYARTGNRAISEDVAQEAFVVAWRRLAELDQPGNFRRWLCGIARNIAAATRRKQAREVPGAIADDTPASDPSALEQIISEETEQVVWSALEQVDDQFREPLVLFYREGQSLKQVAHALDISHDAAKQRVHRGRQQLKDEVARVVETTLDRSRPSAKFAGRVMAAVAATAALNGGTASAATGAAKVATQTAGIGKALWLTVALIAGGALFTTWALRSANQPPSARGPEQTALAGAAGDNDSSANTKGTGAAARASKTANPQRQLKALIQPKPAAARQPSAVTAAYRGLMPKQTDTRRRLSRKIDLTIRDAGVYQVLRILAQVGDIDLIAREKIDAKVTVRAKGKPLLEVLDSVLAQAGAKREEVPALRVVARGIVPDLSMLRGTKTISAHFVEAPLRDVLKVIGAQIEPPLYALKGVDAKITVVLKDMHAGPALAKVLRKANLGLDTGFAFLLKKLRHEDPTPQ